MLRLVPLLRQLPGRLWSTETRQQAGLASAPGRASFGSEPCSCPLLVGQQPLPLTDRGPGVIPAPQLMANTVEQPKTSTVNDPGRICTLSIAPGHNKVFLDNPGAMTDGKGVQHLPSREQELKEATDRLELTHAEGSSQHRSPHKEAFAESQTAQGSQPGRACTCSALLQASEDGSAEVGLAGGTGSCLPASFFLREPPGRRGYTLQTDTRRSQHERRGVWSPARAHQLRLSLRQTAVLQRTGVLDQRCSRQPRLPQASTLGCGTTGPR